MEFKYFRDPENFAFLANEPSKCSVCGCVKTCFNADGYSGVQDIDCICYDCLVYGKLKELDIEANLNFDDGSEASETITYKTPALPTWQDTTWPYINGEFPIFEKIADKNDFKDKKHFLETFIGDQDKSEIEWLWDVLPGRKISNYKDAGDVSVYLFTLNGKKYWVWDAN